MDDGKNWYRGGQLMSFKFNDFGLHKIKLQIGDSRGRKHEVAVPLTVAPHSPEDWGFKINPRSYIAQLRGDRLAIRWPKREAYEYMLVALNSLPIAYVKTAQGGVDISDLLPAELENFRLAFMDQDFNFGEFTDVDISKMKDGDMVSAGEMAGGDIEDFPLEIVDKPQEPKPSKPQLSQSLKRANRAIVRKELSTQLRSGPEVRDIDDRNRSIDPKWAPDRRSNYSAPLFDLRRERAVKILLIGVLAVGILLVLLMIYLH